MQRNCTPICNVTWHISVTNSKLNMATTSTTGPTVYHIAVRVFQIFTPIGIRRRWRSKVQKEASTCQSTNDNVAAFHPIYKVMRSPTHFNPPLLPPPLPNFDSGHEMENRLSRSNFEVRGSTFSILSFRASERRMRYQGII